MVRENTILIVDDEVKITEVIKSYLENSGYLTACAYDGKNAMSLFEKCSPVLIILDLMLPDMTGEDICREIRKKSRVPIIMLTAKVEDADIINGLGIGADDCIARRNKTVLGQNDMLDTHFRIADFVIVFDTEILREFTDLLAVVSRLNVLVRRKVIRNQRNLVAVENL